MAEDSLSHGRQCYVYWCFDDKCICWLRHGYIGWAYVDRWWKRKSVHRRRFGNYVRFQILFRGSKSECRTREAQLRETKFVGWNYNPGGGGGFFGKHSEESKRKMREAARLPITDAVKEKLRISSTGRTNKGRIGQKKSEEEKAKIAAGHTGKKHSEEHVRKQSIRALGNQWHLGHTHTTETKERIRLKKIGVPIHSEEEKKKRFDRWKGNALTKGKPWSAARRLAWLQRQQ